MGTARQPLQRAARAILCQFQHIPTHPLQGMAKPCSQGGGTSESEFKKGTGTGEGGGKCEKQPCEHQGQRRRIGGRTPGTRAKIPLQPMVAWGGPMSEQEDAS